MKRVPSLRSRLVVLVGGGLLALLLAQYVSTALVLNEREEDMIDVLLNEQMQYSMQLYHDGGKPLRPNIPHMVFHVFPLGQPDPSVPADFLSYGPGNHAVDIGETEYHFVVHDEDGMRFLLAYDVEQYEDGFTELMAILGIAFLLSAVLAISGIYWLSGRALQNLTRLADEVHYPDSAAFFHSAMEAEVGALALALDNYRAHQPLLLERERDFSGHLSHELRTPLTVVRARAELMALQYPDEPQLQKNSTEIMAAADRMRTMVEQLLHLARRTHTPQRETIKLRELIDRIWGDLSEAGNSRTSLDNRLADDASVFADPLLLELILRNAFANARRHANGAELRIDFDQHQLLIEDFASGDAIFSQPEGVEEEGAGLGLAILHRACAVLGWSCQITTLPTGTRLALRIS